MIERRHTLAEAGESFAFETTCAARGHAQFLRRCRDLGYRLTLVFLWLPSPAAAIARVAQRVSEGGHNVPPEVVKRRYLLGICNMRQLYFPLVDCALVYYNSEHGLVKIAERQVDGPVIVHDQIRWRSIEDIARDRSHDKAND
jgi:predicted ABC-type ATPase